MDCRNCKYYLPKETSHYHRCLLVYGQAIAKEILKDGLIGRCKDYSATQAKELP
jgi:hypothetical protein